MVSSFLVSAGSSKLVENDWQIKSLIFSGINSWYSENSKTCYYFWFIAACTLIFDRNYRRNVFYQGRNEKVSALDDFSRENYPFLLLQLNFDLPKNQEVFSIGSLLDILTRVSPWPLTCSLPSKTQSKASYLS